MKNCFKDWSQSRKFPSSCISCQTKVTLTQVFQLFNTMSKSVMYFKVKPFLRLNHLSIASLLLDIGNCLPVQCVLVVFPDHNHLLLTYILGFFIVIFLALEIFRFQLQ